MQNPRSAGCACPRTLFEVETLEWVMDMAGIQLVDVGIFFSMGALWVLGATFIVLVWRWVIRYERENPDKLNRPPVPRPAAPNTSDARDAAPRSGLASGMLG